jgi:hypothetical protein
MTFALHPVRYSAHLESVIVPKANPVTKAQSVATAEGFLQISPHHKSQTHSPS